MIGASIKPFSRSTTMRSSLSSVKACQPPREAEATESENALYIQLQGVVVGLYTRIHSTQK